MKNTLLLLAAIILVSASCNQEKSIELFNGRNLDNWTIFLPDSIDAGSVFKVSDGLLHVGGIPNGYIRTKDEYSSYELHVEWRWVEEPKNSGVLLQVTGEDMLWPNCIEAQLMAGNAGDFVLIGKGVGMTVKDSTYLVTSEENRYKVIAKYGESSENEAGEWNSYDIMVSSGFISIKVNGVLQNECINPTKSKGNICIQSEGGPMEFRNIVLKPQG